ncbi:MAG: YlmH/Sll1252 family protein [Erysipelotrichaceae bacterium]
MNFNSFKQIGGNEEFVARIQDWLSQSKKRHKLIVTPFLTPDKQLIVQQVIGKSSFYYFDGGYENAESKRAIIGSDIVEQHVFMLEAKYDTNYHTIDHRDVLGALMNAGIVRDSFGDIHVIDGHIYLFTTKEMMNYIIQTVTRINRASIEFQQMVCNINFSADIVWDEKLLTSCRCDVVVASITKLSRSKAQALIKSGFVKINQVILEDCDRVCNNNSTISIRGYGRFKLLMTDRMSKKGNYVVSIGTYR